ncbi:MAG TPA: UvrD-helicase domain-containing protein [Gaiellaceae bacterium]|jgi:ATP-dependent exoDNAse (exonuclease V) beta subunit|nr:UvrD-helicase domain-containing protein [Gaiellaceae bacterium]
MNPEQRAAVAATGEVFVSAGAGTGKTSVLVERFVGAVCEQGLDVESVLVITYTRKAAGELRARIRAALRARGRHDLARRLDGAWISTIHGFCSRLLRAHPFAVGIDPRFREVDDEHGAVIRGEAFERALTAFCATRDSERLRLLATYGAQGLRRMLTGVYETLRSAGRDLKLELGEHASIPERLAELHAAAQALAADPDVTDKQLAAANAALALSSNPEQLLDLSHLAAGGDRTAEFRGARDRLNQAAFDELASRDSELLQELLDLFAAEYAAAKARESSLDFEDLQLYARDLLRDHTEIREAEQLRFRAIMVDEFQDTNRLQCEIVDLLRKGLSAPDVFFVGDEFQSIYGFRHADVAVFRERRERAALRLPLSRNYRSRPEVLAAVNHLFSEEFGDGYQPLAASGEFSDPVFGHPVELLVSDKRSYREAGENWRDGEARSIARRVRELVDNGIAAPGEIVLLFAAGTDAERYEAALRAQDLPTYRATGRGYFGQQQVVDLLSYLRLLHNRYDDEALVTVLASPFVGVSNDGLVHIRRHAGKRPLYTGIERSLPEPLSEDDQRLVRAFKQRYDRLAAASARQSLERLCEEIVSAHDYDLAVLAQWDGRRRYANLRKLMRLARSYEQLRGPDIEGFVGFIRDQQAVGASQLEAVSEEEGADAVRLLTIHAAKGLEFKVVIVADAGRDTGGVQSSDEILVRADGTFGFRVIDPRSGKKRGVFSYEEVRKSEIREDTAERLRLYYVAMTRAIDRLIVSGAIDHDRQKDRDTPIGWVLARLELDGGIESGELERGDARFVLSVDRWTPQPVVEAEPPAVDEAGQLALFAELPSAPAPRGYRLPELSPLPPPPLHKVRRLSYSALALFERCSYRYYVERIAGLREERGTIPGSHGLKATEVGDAVHRLLELVDLRAPVAPDVEIVRTWYSGVTGEELERISRFVASYCESELAARIATLEGAEPERPFAFEHDGVLLRGRLDVLWREGARALVLDYKTNSLAEGSPEEIVEADYRLQRLVYALACFRAGADEVEVVYHFLERPDAVVSTTFSRIELPVLEEELSAAIRRIDAGEFVPTPSEFTCSGCPALDLVCAGPNLRQSPGRLVAAA